MALRQYQTDLYEHSPKENTPSYHAYQRQSTHKQQVKDIIFISRIALFGILSVCATYVYLSFSISTFLALPLGLVSGFVGLVLIRFSHIVYRNHKKKNRYKA